MSKKDVLMQMRIGYQILNRVTVKNNNPLPKVEDILDMLAVTSYFSIIDINSGYYQIRINKVNMYKTTIRNRYGSYEFLVILFGFAMRQQPWCSS